MMWVELSHIVSVDNMSLEKPTENGVVLDPMDRRPLIKRGPQTLVWSIYPPRQPVLVQLS